jgi:hypothetical protein
VRVGWGGERDNVSTSWARKESDADEDDDDYDDEESDDDGEWSRNCRGARAKVV